MCDSVYNWCTHDSVNKGKERELGQSRSYLLFEIVHSFFFFEEAQMKSPESQEPKQRKPYIKPQLGIVNLAPKQTVLGGCYSISDPTPRGGSSCATADTCHG